MNILAVLLGALFLGAPAAAIIDPLPILQLPACPRNCVFSTMKQAGELGCPGAKPECMCKSKQYQAKLEECAKECSSQEADQMRNAGRKICNDIHALMGRDNPDYADVEELDAELLFDTGLVARQFPSGLFPFPTGLIPTGLIPTGLFPGLIPTKFPGGLIPTGLIPTGLIPTGLIPTGLIPTGLIPTGLIPTGLIPPGLIPSGLIPGLAMSTGEPAPEMTKRAELPATTRMPADRVTLPGADIPQPTHTHHTHARDFAM